MTSYHIKRYLERKTSPEETEHIRSWLINPEHDAEVRRILGELWAHSEIKLNGQAPDFDRMLDKLHHRINNAPIRQVQSRTLLATLYQTFSKIAAILFVPLMLISAYLYFTQVQPSKFVSSNIREIYTKPGTRTQIDLSDGTRVWLNDGTTFRYPESFSGEKREVYVDGEAYFEVHSNPKNPFIVNNPIMNTVVTGTHFNLHAYSADQYFEATLLEGKVRLERNDQKWNLIPGEQVQFDSQLEKTVRRRVNPADAAAWVNGILIFKNEKLSTAIKKLARWYNVEIIISDPKISNYLLTGRIQDEKLDQMLKLIALALPVTFEFKKVNHPTEIERIIYMKRK